MVQMPRTQRVRIWLAIAGSFSVMLGTAYTLTQQSTRLAVDDQPLAAAQTAKHELESGAAPADVVPTVKTDLKTDSTVFVIVTDAQEHILASSARLDGQTTLPPEGTFDTTATKGTDHFTWQPAVGARLATRMLAYTQGSTKGYIITGQSLSQAEDRIGTYGWMVLAAWLVILTGSYLALFFPL